MLSKCKILYRNSELKMFCSTSRIVCVSSYLLSELQDQRLKSRLEVYTPALYSEISCLNPVQKIGFSVLGSSWNLKPNVVEDINTVFPASWDLKMIRLTLWLTRHFFFFCGFKSPWFSRIRTQCDFRDFSKQISSNAGNLVYEVISYI
jgi:hypothetical protein